MCNTIICSKSTTTDTGVILIPNQTITPENISCGRLIIACNINTPTANLPLYIQTSEGNCPVLCKYGNNILANQVNKRVPYPIAYGNQNSSYTAGQFVIQSCACLNNRGAESNVTTTNGASEETNNSTNTRNVKKTESEK